MKKLSFALATIALLGAYSANAAEYPTNQFYVGADFGGLHFDLDDEDAEVIATDYFLGQVNAGFQVHPNLAVELGYFRTNDANKEIIEGFADTSTTLQGVYFDAIGNYEFVENARILGSAGLAYINSSTDGEILDEEVLPNLHEESTTVLKLGLGASYDITENISARTLVNYYDTEATIVTYTAGLQYRF